MPATSAYQLQIQTESNPNPTGIPLPNSSTNCWTLFTCTRGSAEAQHKKSHSCLELLLLLILLLLQLGVGCYSGCCLRFCQLIWQAAAPGTRHQAPGTRHQGTSAPARTHTEAEAEVIPDKQCVEGAGGVWEHGGRTVWLRFNAAKSR